MNKKFMVVALMAALSTVGFAYDLPHTNAEAIDGSGKIGATKGNENFNSLAGEINRIDGEISTIKGTMEYVEGQVNKNTEALAEKVDQKEFDKYAGKVDGMNVEIGNMNNQLDEHAGRLDELNLDMSTIKGTVENIDITNGKQQEQLNKHEEALAGKVDQKEFDEYAGKVDGMNVEIGNMNNQLDEHAGRLDIVEENAEAGLILAQKNENSISDLYANKVDNSKFEEHKKQQEAKDNDQDKDIQANKDAIAQNKNDIAANKDAIEKETADRIAADNEIKEQVGKFQDQMNKYDGRLSGLEKKVDHLDDKMNKGLSLMAAMNAVDFQNVQTGEMAIGAGVGHYGNAQSVALGVAYSPVEDLTVNAKYSVTAGDADSFALGAGATYKFKVGR